MSLWPKLSFTFILILQQSSMFKVLPSKLSSTEKKTSILLIYVITTKIIVAHSLRMKSFLIIAVIINPLYQILCYIGWQKNKNIKLRKFIFFNRFNIEMKNISSPTLPFFLGHWNLSTRKLQSILSLLPRVTSLDLIFNLWCDTIYI